MHKITLSMLAVLWMVMISHDPIVAAAPEKSKASEPRKLSEEKARALAVYAPRPPYPELARAQGITGSGVVRVSVDASSGVVTAAQMQLSTGHKFLDDVALAAFRKWRFRPGTVSHVRIPITFSMRSLYVRVLGNRSWLQNVTNWSLPYYPLQAIYKGVTGSGVAILKIDARTGSVTSASMLKSTGRQVLDNAMLQAFRQWRFKPGTLTTLEIPIEFTSVSPNG
jgi:TonB family protein